MSPSKLRSLYVLCGLAALALAGACNSSGSSSAVAPLPVHSAVTTGPTQLPTSSPTPSPKPTPTPSPTPKGTPTPSPTPSPTSSGCGGSNSNTQPLGDGGGVLTLPPYCTFSGSVAYASNNAPANETIMFQSNVQNLNGVPNPNGGTPVFYTRVEIGTQPGTNIAFNDCTTCNATLSSSTLVPSQTYALCAYIGKFIIQSTPLVAGQPSNGTLTYPSPLTAEGLKATGGVLPTGVAIDTVVTEGVPKNC